MKYAILYNEQIHHEGDERSRTNPGHGYPAYTETVEKFKSFDTEEQLLTWIMTNNKRSYNKATFKAIRYEFIDVKEEVKITLQ